VGMARNLRCLLGRHQWCTVTNAGGYDADCWVCGKPRRIKARVVHRDVKAQYDAARARDEALAVRDSYVLATGTGPFETLRASGPGGYPVRPRRRGSRRARARDTS
jgi:hypothetical protein